MNNLCRIWAEQMTLGNKSMWREVNPLSSSQVYMMIDGALNAAQNEPIIFQALNMLQHGLINV